MRTIIASDILLMLIKQNTPIKIYFIHSGARIVFYYDIFRRIHFPILRRINYLKIIKIETTL